MKTVTPRAVVSVIATILLMTGCASQPKITVSSDYSVANFDQFKTFQWLPEGLESEGEKSDNDVVGKFIINNINFVLAKKGYQQELEATPDFYVNYSVSTADKIEIDNQKSYEGYAPGFTWRRGYGAQATDAKVEIFETSIIEYLEGTLIVDVIDPVDLKIIWRGMGTKELPEHFDYDITEKLITNIVAATLENYPPPME